MLVCLKIAWTDLKKGARVSCLAISSVGGILARKEYLGGKKIKGLKRRNILGKRGQAGERGDQISRGPRRKTKGLGEISIRREGGLENRNK